MDWQDWQSLSRLERSEIFVKDISKPGKQSSLKSLHIFEALNFHKYKTVEFQKYPGSINKK